MQCSQILPCCVFMAKEHAASEKPKAVGNGLPRHLTEACRAVALACHSAAGLAAEHGSQARCVCRLLRSAEALARAATASLAGPPVGQDKPKEKVAESPDAAVDGKPKRRRNRRHHKVRKAEMEVEVTPAAQKCELQARCAAIAARYGGGGCGAGQLASPAAEASNSHHDVDRERSPRLHRSDVFVGTGVPHMCFYPGMSARLVGLHKREDLNGTAGVLDKFVDLEQRWVFKTPTGGSLTVKASNLMAINESDAGHSHTVSSSMVG